LAHSRIIAILALYHKHEAAWTLLWRRFFTRIPNGIRCSPWKNCPFAIAAASYGSACRPIPAHRGHKPLFHQSIGAPRSCRYGPHLDDVMQGRGTQRGQKGSGSFCTSCLDPGPSGAVRPPRRLGKLVSDSDSPGTSLVRCFGIAQLLNLFLQTVQPDTTTPVPPWATEGGSFRNPASGPRT
jgi:hypothetical protein